MIMNLDRTIKQLLTAELPIKNGGIDVQFDQPAQQYQICKQTLQDELGIESMTETQRLYNEIKSGNSLTDILPAKKEGFDSLTFA